MDGQDTQDANTGFEISNLKTQALKLKTSYPVHPVHPCEFS
jgi:hypothetical protein